MHFHMTNLEFFICCATLVAILVFAGTALRARRRNLRAPFRNYFCTQFEHDYPQQRRFSEIDD